MMSIKRIKRIIKKKTSKSYRIKEFLWSHYQEKDKPRIFYRFKKKWMNFTVRELAKAAGVTAYGKDQIAQYYVRNVGNNVDGGQWAAGYTKEGKLEEGLSMTSTTSGARVCMNILLGEVK